MNDAWHSVSSRILWSKLQFSRVKVYVVVRYGPNEGDGLKIG